MEDGTGCTGTYDGRTSKGDLSQQPYDSARCYTVNTLFEIRTILVYDVYEITNRTDIPPAPGKPSPTRS